MLARSTIISGVEDFLEALATKHKVDESTFDDWKTGLIRCIDSKIEHQVLSIVTPKFNQYNWFLPNHTIGPFQIGQSTLSKHDNWSLPFETGRWNKHCMICPFQY